MKENSFTCTLGDYYCSGAPLSTNTDTQLSENAQIMPKMHNNLQLTVLRISDQKAQRQDNQGRNGWVYSPEVNTDARFCLRNWKTNLHLLSSASFGFLVWIHLFFSLSLLFAEETRKHKLYYYVPLAIGIMKDIFLNLFPIFCRHLNLVKYDLNCIFFAVTCRFSRMWAVQFTQYSL